MNQSDASKIPSRRRVLSVAALAAAVAVALSPPALAENATPPAVPESLTIPEGNVAYLVGHATGTQNYVCVPKDGKIQWVLYTPQATLFTDAGRQIITHFFSPNPAATSEFLPTWQHSRDTSAVWVKADADPYTGSDFVEPGAVAWLRLRAVTAEGGPNGDSLTDTTYIHRVNTSGGLAPSTGCAAEGDLGQKRFIPYAADYYFYKAED